MEHAETIDAWGIQDESPQALAYYASTAILDTIEAMDFTDAETTVLADAIIILQRASK